MNGYLGTPSSYNGVNESVSQQFWGVGGTPPYTFSITSGSLPTGLILNPASGLISGIATTAGNFNFTLKVQDAAGNDFSRGYGWRISPLYLVNIPQRTLPNAFINLAYMQTLLISGGTPPYIFTLDRDSNLPTGFSLSSGGIISGTPLAAAVPGRFTVIIKDSATTPNTIRLSMSLAVVPQVPTPLTFNNSILSDAAVGDNRLLGGIGASGGVPPYMFDLAPGSSLPNGAVLVPGHSISFDWDPNPQAAFIWARVRAPGVYSFVLRVTDSAGNVATRPLTWRVSPIDLTYASIPSGNPRPVLGTPYSLYLVPAGGTAPYTITPDNIPAGMSINNQGLFSGTPAEVGLDLPFRLTVTDFGGFQYSPRFDAEIDANTPVSLGLNGGDFGIRQKGAGYAANLSCSGSLLDPPTYAITLVSGSLPPGLMLLSGGDFNNSATPSIAAQIAGTANTAGNYSFIVRCTDGAGNIGQREIHMRVSNLALVNTGIASGYVGSPYNQTLEVRGGRTPSA